MYTARWRPLVGTPAQIVPLPVSVSTSYVWDQRWCRRAVDAAALCISADGIEPYSGAVCGMILHRSELCTLTCTLSALSLCLWSPHDTDVRRTQDAATSDLARSRGVLRVRLAVGRWSCGACKAVGFLSFPTRDYVRAGARVSRSVVHSCTAPSVPTYALYPPPYASTVEGVPRKAVEKDSRNS